MTDLNFVINVSVKTMSICNNKKNCFVTNFWFSLNRFSRSQKMLYCKTITKILFTKLKIKGE